ncbi:RtcB family protein [Candidatus Pacearchaeota archaeon]|jgi:RNA-splicing ligase RtcB|nr:RtcB family protein [bacterium]MCK9597040.1 RtcB family protein [Candidatus Pacearchaeota archaeon]
MFDFKGKYTNGKIFAETIETEAVSQIYNMANNCSFTNYMAIMPDAHKGSGSCIGFTMKMPENRIVPNIIGVDIGCSISAIEVKDDMGEKFKSSEIVRMVRDRIPFGPNVHEKEIYDFEKEFDWEDVNKKIKTISSFLNSKYCPIVDYNWLKNHCKKIGMDFQKVILSCGTVGGGE